MLRVLSDLTIADRIDIAPASGATYNQGDWVLANGTNNYALDKYPMGIVFNMYDSSQTNTLSIDTAAVALDSTQDASIGGAEKITVIAGYVRGVTDRISTAYGTPSAGDPLTTVSGLLCAVPNFNTTNPVVAILEEALTGFEHRGASYTAWRFKTV